MVLKPALYIRHGKKSRLSPRYYTNYHLLLSVSDSYVFILYHNIRTLYNMVEASFVRLISYKP